MFQKISNLFGVALMYEACDRPGFIGGPKYVCELATWSDCFSDYGTKTYIKYTYDTRSGERCEETKVRCC